MQKLFLTLLAGHLLQAAPIPQSIPRSSSKNFQAEGIFEGGGSAPMANIAGLRFSPHPKEGFERWVVDFSNEPQRLVGTAAPAFQIRYMKPEKVPVSSGSDIVIEPPKFVLTFRSINRNLIKKADIEKFLKKSKYVKNIVLYPPIEGGDTAVEFLLKDSVLFETHQPIEKEGRLVLDLRNAPLGQ